jgi:hypothetical protein
LLSTRRGGRLVIGALVGELLGAVVGLLVAPRRHVDATVASTKKPSYGNPADTSDDDDFDPKVAWPVLAGVVGLVIGVGVVRMDEKVRRGGRTDEGADQRRAEVDHR